MVNIRTAPMRSFPFSYWIVFGALLFAPWASLIAQSKPQADQAIRDKLAGPPTFLDEKHQGPTLVPTGLPTWVFPFDCRATQAYIHRMRPGEYHFQRAQRLLGQGIDVIGCEAFGLDRFRRPDDPLLLVDQAVREAESAATSSAGVDQWAPGALRSVLSSAYSEAAKAYAEYGAKHSSATHLAQAKAFAAKAELLKQKDQGAGSGNKGGVRTPLMAAVLQNDLAAVSRLLSEGADINSTDADYTSALRLAVVASNVEMVKLLLAKGAKPDERDDAGVAALMDACSMGRADVAILLLDSGTNLNSHAADGSTPLLDAVGSMAIGRNRDSRRDFVRLLVNKGAAVNASDWAGISPLIAATRGSDPELVRLLVSVGANIESTDSEGETPLISAVSKDNIAAVRILLERHAKMAIFNKRGQSPLTLSAKNGYPEGEQITKLLLDAGADANLANTSGQTPLMSAEGFNYREPWGVSSHAIIRELLKHDANPNARSKSGETPLIVAAGHFGPDDASFLLELVDSGAEVNTADEDGQTALMAAAERGHVTKVRFLLEHGAKADAKDKVGRTALQYARRPRNDRDDEFPQCYDSLNGDGSKRTNDCAETRRTLQRALDSTRRSTR